MKHVRRCQCHWRTCVAYRSQIAFQDVLLLLLLAVVSVEINQRENVHLPLGSVLSVRRPGVGRRLTCLGGLRRKCCVAVLG